MADKKDNANSLISFGPCRFRRLSPQPTNYQFTPQLRFAENTMGQQQPVQQHSIQQRGPCFAPTSGNPHSVTSNFLKPYSRRTMANLASQCAVQPFAADALPLQRNSNRVVAQGKDGTPQPQGRLESEKWRSCGAGLTIEDLRSDESTHAVGFTTPSMYHAEKPKKTLGSRASSPKATARTEGQCDMSYVDLLRQAALPIGKKPDAAARGKKSEPSAGKSLAKSARLKFSRHVASPAMHQSKQREASPSDQSTNSTRMPAALRFVQSRPQEHKKKPLSTRTSSSLTSSHATNEKTVMSHATYDAAVSMSSSSTTLAPTSACSQGKKCLGGSPPVTLHTNINSVNIDTANGTKLQQQFVAPVAAWHATRQPIAPIGIFVPNHGCAHASEVAAATQRENSDSVTLQHTQRAACDAVQCTSTGLARNTVAQSLPTMHQHLMPSLAQNIHHLNRNLQCTLRPTSMVRAQSVRSIACPPSNSTMMRAQSISCIPNAFRPPAIAPRVSIPTPQQNDRVVSQLQSPQVVGSIVRSVSCQPSMCPPSCSMISHTNGLALTPYAPQRLCTAPMGANPMLGTMGTVRVSTAPNALCTTLLNTQDAEEPHPTINPVSIRDTRMANDSAFMHVDTSSLQKSSATTRERGIDSSSHNHRTNSPEAHRGAAQKEMMPPSREGVKRLEYERFCGRDDDSEKRITARRSGARGTHTVTAAKPLPFR